MMSLLFLYLLCFYFDKLTYRPIEWMIFSFLSKFSLFSRIAISVFYYVLNLIFILFSFHFFAISLCASMPVCLCANLSVCGLYLSMSPSACLSVCECVCMFTYVSICLSVCAYDFYIRFPGEEFFF